MQLKILNFTVKTKFYYLFVLGCQFTPFTCKYFCNLRKCGSRIFTSHFLPVFVQVTDIACQRLFRCIHISRTTPTLATFWPATSPFLNIVSLWKIKNKTVNKSLNLNKIKYSKEFYIIICNKKIIVVTLHQYKISGINTYITVKVMLQHWIFKKLTK